MAADLNTVIKQLTESSIIAQGKLDNFVPPKAHPTSVDEFVAELVKQLHLTLFQAQQVKAGKAKALILGEYTIVDKIGAGGMGQVFKSLHRRMDRTVAIKMLPPAMTKDAAAVARFEREVRAAAKLSHPNIVAAHDAGQAGAAHFLVMEYVEGQDLSAMVKKNGPFPVGKALNYVLQTARGLEFAHSEGVVHRDIKPANLLLDKRGVVKILDMGLARIESAVGSPAQAELTGTGTIMGTVDYMAPEQGLSTKHADARADIYSLGCSLYYLIVGKAAYDGETVAAKLVAHHTHPIPSLQEAHPEIPNQLEAVFKKMVAKKIEDRYQTMTEVVAELERCQAALHASASSSASARQATLTDQESELSIAFSHAREHLIPRVETEDLKPKPKPVRKAKARPPSTRAQAGPGSGRKRPVLIGLVAAGVLGLGILAAVIVIQMRTADGTLIVEVNQPDAIVQVLSQEGKVEISQPGGLKPVSIAVVPGKHRIRVEKDGYVTIADDIEVFSGTMLDIKARLVPAKQVANAKTLLPPGEGFGASAQPSGGRRPDEGARPWQSPAFQAWIKTTQALPAEQQLEAVRKKLMELNPGFDGKLSGYDGVGTPKIAGGVVTELGICTDDVTDISPVRALAGLDHLNCSGGSLAAKAKFSDLSPLAGMALRRLLCTSVSVSDLSPLAGMPLTELHAGYNNISDLSPLRGMSLTVFDCSVSEVADLSPLKGMPLTVAHFADTMVSDLSPLAGMPLARINCDHTWVTDLSALRGMKLTEIRFSPKSTTAGIDVLRQMASLKLVAVGGGAKDKFTPAEFWKKYDAGEFGKPAAPAKLAYLDPAFQAWVKATQALPAEKQIEAVSKKLMELNPGFDGKLTGYGADGTPRVVGGVVTTFGIATDAVTDISPVRALTGLKELRCAGGSGGKRGRLSDISPLRGMALTLLFINANDVSDLSPLAGMKLTGLYCEATPISDLSALKGMPLATVDCAITPVSDLSPLAGSPLKTVNCINTNVSDLSPIAGMSLVSVGFTPNRIASGLEIIRQMKSIQTIAAGGGPHERFTPAEFWKRYDAGEFGKAAAPAKLAYLDPAFQTWVKATQALPAEKQIEAVSKKLVELNQGFDGVVSDYRRKGPPKVENGAVTEFSFVADNVTDISPVRALAGLKILECGGSGRGSKLSDLSPLQGMNIAILACSNTRVSDLSPLRGMKLTHLYCSGTPLSDLSPLRAAPMTILYCHATQVSDLSPLELCKNLTTLKVIKTEVTAASVAALQKALPKCKIEWDAPAKLAYLDPAFQAWIKTTQALPAEQQLEAVSKKLIELNPGFDGNVAGYERTGTPKIEKGAVTEIGFFTDKLTDISPVRALVRLKWLRCSGSSSTNRGVLTDLSPLQGLSLTKLSCVLSQVSDLSPLGGMKLTSLWCDQTPIPDLSPLHGMPLTILSCGDTKISDLSALQGMALTYLNCGYTQVSDLSPLSGMPLALLECHRTSISDLSPLRGMNLTRVVITPKAITAGLDVIRQMKSLKTIAIGSDAKDQFPAAEFWKKYDAGEFGKPAAPAPGGAR